MNSSLFTYHLEENKFIDKINRDNKMQSHENFDSPKKQPTFDDIKKEMSTYLSQSYLRKQGRYQKQLSAQTRFEEEEKKQKAELKKQIEQEQGIELEESNIFNPNDYFNIMVDKSSEEMPIKNNDSNNKEHLSNMVFHKTKSIISDSNNNTTNQTISNNGRQQNNSRIMYQSNNLNKNQSLRFQALNSQHTKIGSKISMNSYTQLEENQTLFKSELIEYNGKSQGNMLFGNQRIKNSGEKDNQKDYIQNYQSFIAIADEPESGMDKYCHQKNIKRNNLSQINPSSPDNQNNKQEQFSNLLADNINEILQESNSLSSNEQSQYQTNLNQKESKNLFTHSSPYPIDSTSLNENKAISDLRTSLKGNPRQQIQNCQFSKNSQPKKNIDCNQNQIQNNCTSQSQTAPTKLLLPNPNAQQDLIFSFNDRYDKTNSPLQNNLLSSSVLDSSLLMRQGQLEKETSTQLIKQEFKINDKNGQHNNFIISTLSEEEEVENETEEQSTKNSNFEERRLETMRKKDMTKYQFTVEANSLSQRKKVFQEPHKFNQEPSLNSALIFYHTNSILSQDSQSRQVPEKMKKQATIQDTENQIININKFNCAKDSLFKVDDYSSGNTSKQAEQPGTACFSYLEDEEEVSACFASGGKNVSYTNSKRNSNQIKASHNLLASHFPAQQHSFQQIQLVISKQQSDQLPSSCENEIGIGTAATLSKPDYSRGTFSFQQTPNSLLDETEPHYEGSYENHQSALAYLNNKYRNNAQNCNINSFPLDHSEMRQK